MRLAKHRHILGVYAGRTRVSHGQRHVELALSGSECQGETVPTSGEARVLDDRKLDVLRAIVQDYVSTREPVGSKALVERHNLGVSPATIRNDMAVLEEEGYITQPHTSAGRIPTDKGYRLFVDRLTEIKPLSPAERRAIQTFLDGAVDVDDVVHRTVRLLAQITRQVAVVQYPSLVRSSIRHVELVSLSGHRLLIVVITDTGRVEQRTVDVGYDVDEDLLGALRTRINAAVSGLRLNQVADVLTTLSVGFPEHAHAVVTAVIATLLEALSERHDERVAVAGTANLSRFGHDFDLTIRPVLEALEEHVVLLRLLGEATRPSLLTVRIGHENPYDYLSSASVVSVGYGSGDEALGTMGVLGPTRMDYPGTMAAVGAVARYVSQILAGN
jgi:heat-inducible transcriptional repressor